MVLSFYRRRAGDHALQRLAGLANLGLTALARSVPDMAGAASIGRIDARIAAVYPQLTRRERQVCVRTLAGWSARAIAATLGIGPASVLTYRQRAYRRLGFSCAADFLGVFV